MRKASTHGAPSLGSMILALSRDSLVRRVMDRRTSVRMIVALHAPSDRTIAPTLFP
jgi:hypothetical protein